MMFQTRRNNRSSRIALSVACLEALEGRQLLAAAPWNVYANITGQSTVAQNYPQLTGAGQSIAIIDTGVDYRHPALGGGFGPGRKVVAGYDFQSYDADPFSSTNGHGTGVASSAAANGFTVNGYYAQGIAPGANIIALRQASGTGIKQALQWVIANRTKYNIVAANITDFSGGDYRAELATLASQGVFITEPAGNGGASAPWDYKLANVFTIGGSDRNDNVWSGSTRGPGLELIAPADRVSVAYYDASTGRDVTTDQGSGTSFAAPAVAGAAALIKQINPYFSPTQIMQILKDSGVSKYDSASGLTYKRLNLAGAVNLAYLRSGQVIPAQQTTTTPTPTTTTTSPTPYYGTPINLPAVIQAEDFDNNGYKDTTATNLSGQYRNTPVDIEKTSDTGGGFDVAFTQAGEFLSYTVKLATAGNYNLGFRMATPAAGAKFHVEIDGQAKTGSISVPATGGWQNWQTINVPNVSLPSGQHSLKVVFETNSTNGFAPNFNWVSVAAATAPTTTPTTTATGLTPFSGTPVSTGQIVEMENFDNGGEGLAYRDTDAANLGGKYRSTGVDIESTTDAGGGYSIGWTKAGEWTNYTMNIPAAGQYNLDLRYAAAYSGASFRLMVDGKDMTGAVALPATGGWQTWKTLTRTGINLPAGKHIIAIVMNTNTTAGFGANLNWFKLSAPTPASTPFYGTPISVGQYIQAEDFDNGGDGVAYHDTETANLGGAYRQTGVDLEASKDLGGGADVGFAKAGEWLQYTLNVGTTGTYKFDARVASAFAGSAFHVEIDGQNVTGPITVGSTGGWQNWQTITRTGIALSAGKHTMRVVVDANNASGFAANMNWFRFYA